MKVADEEKVAAITKIKKEEEELEDQIGEKNEENSSLIGFTFIF